MPKSQSLADFYQEKMQWMLENLQQDLAHFNVFRLDDFVGPHAHPLPYSRKDFYKISLVVGQNRYHYANKVVTMAGAALLFAADNDVNSEVGQLPQQLEKLGAHF